MPEEPASPTVLYTHLSPSAFRRRLAEAPIAYLPLGTLEWHGEHLPLGSDGLQSQGFFIRLARRVGGVVLPMLFVGPDLHQSMGGEEFYGMDIVGFPDQSPRQLDGSAYWVDEALFISLLESILSRLARAGFKIVVAHGHGPSTNLFDRHRQEWAAKFSLELFICWDTVGGDEDTGIQTDHAAANETSLVMALHPELVEMDQLSKDPEVWPLAIIGKDPRLHASPEMGERVIQKNLDWMEAVLRESLRRSSHE